MVAQMETSTAEHYRNIASYGGTGMNALAQKAIATARLIIDGDYTDEGKVNALNGAVLMAIAMGADSDELRRLQMNLVDKRLEVLKNKAIDDAQKAMLRKEIEIRAAKLLARMQ